MGDPHRLSTSTPATKTDPPQLAFLKLTLLVLLVYAGMALFYSNPNLNEAWQTREMFVWPVTGILLWSYWQGYKILKESDIPTRWVVLSGISLALLAVVVPAFHSTDMFGYVNRGWQQVHYHMNPYVHTVDAIPDWQHDPMITNHWVNNPSPYGFLYLLIAKGLCLLGNGNRTLTLAIFKLGNLIMHGLTAVLIGLATKRLTKTSKIRPEMALYLYLWNPLILINTLANAHNDVYMGFFVTLGALFAVIGSWLWILPALMAATLIKYGAVVIFPIAALFLIRQKAWGALIAGGFVSLLILGLSGLPFLPDWQNFHLAEINHNAFVSHGSLHSLIFSAYKTLAKEAIPALLPYRETVRDFLKNTLLLGYGLFYASLLWRRIRQEHYGTLDFVRDALLVMAVLVCLVSLKFYPWYLGMFFPLALFLPEEDSLRRWVLILSGAQLFSITFIGQAHLLNFIIMTVVPTVWVVLQNRRQTEKQAKTTALTSEPVTYSNPPSEPSPANR